MRESLRGTSLLLLFLLGGVAGAQVKQENRTLVVNGQAGQAGVVQVNGRTYVDLENLASIANGSLGFQGNRITLTLAGAGNAPAAAPEPEQAADSGLSRKFVMAAIETLSQGREWASTLAYAIQHGYGVTEAWVADYREKTASSLSLASAAASTDDDRNALQLLTNEFQAVREWSNKLVEAKKEMDTAKYSVSPNALRNDPQSQKIIACAHFLGSMLGSGTFADDPSCH